MRCDGDVSAPSLGSQRGRGTLTQRWRRRRWRRRWRRLRRGAATPHGLGWGEPNPAIASPVRVYRPHTRRPGVRWRRRPTATVLYMACRWLPADHTDAVSHPVGRPLRWGGGRMGGRHGGAAARRRLLCAMAHRARAASPSCSAGGVGARRAELSRLPLRPGGFDGRDAQQQLDARAVLRGGRRRLLL